MRQRNQWKRKKSVIEKIYKKEVIKANDKNKTNRKGDVTFNQKKKEEKATKDQSQHKEHCYIKQRKNEEEKEATTH